MIDENSRSSMEEQNLKHSSRRGEGEASDSEMLKTYSTGLLAVCLSGYVSMVFQFISLAHVHVYLSCFGMMLIDMYLFSSHISIFFQFMLGLISVEVHWSKMY